MIPIRNGRRTSTRTPNVLMRVPVGALAAFGLCGPCAKCGSEPQLSLLKSPIFPAFSVLQPLGRIRFS